VSILKITVPFVLLTEKDLVLVIVNQVCMNMNKLVILAIINVLPVLMLIPVLPVLLILETLPLIVNVKLNIGQMVKFVNHVTSNVIFVMDLLIIVLVVLKID